MIERDEKAMLFTGTRTSSQLKLERERERLSMGFFYVNQYQIHDQLNRFFEIQKKTSFCKKKK